MTISYEEIVEKWKSRDKSKDVFAGHFLNVLVTELSGIENINISYNQTKELFASEYVRNYSGDLRDLYSVQNNRYLAQYLNGQLREGTKITPGFIKKVHGILMKASIDNHRYDDNHERPGEYKKHDYGVGRYDAGVLPEDVDEYITDLCELLEEKSTSDPLRLGAVFHCSFEYIHPFADGNGRTGRWLLNYLLVLKDHPPVLIRTADREEYYKALEQFDVSENVKPMYDFLRECVVKSYPSYSYLLGDRTYEKIEKLWKELPPSLKQNYTGDKETLLRELGMLE